MAAGCKIRQPCNLNLGRNLHRSFDKMISLICVSIHRKGPVVSEDQNLFFFYFLSSCSFISSLDFGATMSEIGHCILVEVEMAILLIN